MNVGMGDNRVNRWMIIEKVLELHHTYIPAIQTSCVILCNPEQNLLISLSLGENINIPKDCNSQ